MKKLSLGIMVLALISSQQVLAKNWQEIKQSGELRIGVPGDYAPLAFHDKQGKLIGYDVDMAKSLADNLNLKVNFVMTSWPTLSEDLAADKFDIAMGGVTATPGRAAQFVLSNAVVKNGKIALANCQQSQKFPTLEAIDRKSVKVIVNPGGTNQSFVDANIKQAQIIRTKDNVANLQGVRDKSADIMFTDLIEGDYYQSKEPGVFCVATAEVLPGTGSYKVYMMAKDNKHLLNEVNQWLSGQTKSTLAHKWNISE
ncbi:transporter substrate-binding domain-containing protein [Yersinia aldovae]|uniref:Extracellular solute-binding protein n=1 Tax=Yersinia aldovae TaxID=29483 RepID=A0A0T9U164_YERAL|nr:transporter substrate-binding domain-containing protein [Yersinia aldovae]EEP96098.1 Polar amino acid ABC transporter, periplasmic amino acid-binding protein [Yersinia aldovae ATCC 35236]CNK22602.1 putative extracellular solute-binding protein [Yersinia aldovae]CNK65566.1 putative extracellular solute-binding protein [Yersinia aldovae]CNL11629.1 putative extracellular solute-binding protein [Yersinia aldovae]